MAITDRTPDTETAAGDLDVPDFMKTDYAPIKVPAVRGEAPAMVVAKRTGRISGSAVRHFGTGVAGTTRAGWRYVRATDREEKLQSSGRQDMEYIDGIRRKRWITAASTAGGGVVLTVAASLGLVLGMGMPAGDAFIAAPAAETAVAGAVITGYGRRINIRRALEAGPTHEAIDGPDGVVGAETLLEAFTAIRVPDGSRVVAHQPGSDGTSVTVVNLPPNFTVTSLRNKVEELAGALGKDVTMVDIQKGAHANQAAIWLSSTDPFEATRPSPLMNRHAPIDTWGDGVPVAWGKRGNVISLPITNANFLIAGMTRSGKGVGAANLATGAAFDPKVNVRIVAGKSNGEWDPAAKAGVASTYFKPDPRRLLALLEVLLEDKDRRERDLGKVGKSKLVPGSISELGGVELLIIDELATYTRPGLPLRDEILAALIKLSSVAAGAGILMVLITQYPEADVIPQALAMNCGTRWAMRVDNATQSNAILGGAASSSGRDASKFDPPRPGLGWLVNPFVGVTDLARSFDEDEDERGEITMLMERAAKFRDTAGRLVGQWDDPIERALQERTGLSSAGGGPDRNGVPGRVLALLDPQDTAAYEALADAVEVMNQWERDAQVDEMATELEMPAERLSELLRRAGAGPTGKITVPHKDGRVNGYKRAHLTALLETVQAA